MPARRRPARRRRRRHGDLRVQPRRQQPRRHAGRDPRPAGVVDAVGDQIEVLLDGGIRRGSDVVKALALGAKAVMIGRAYLWGMAAGGEAGVSNVLSMLRSGVDEALLGLGRSSIHELVRDDLIIPPDFTREPQKSGARRRLGRREVRPRGAGQASSHACSAGSNTRRAGQEPHALRALRGRSPRRGPARRRSAAGCASRARTAIRAADVERRRRRRVAEQHVRARPRGTRHAGSTSARCPSQQPPDWWNISGPCCAAQRAQQHGRRRGDRDPRDALVSTSAIRRSPAPSGCS